MMTNLLNGAHVANKLFSTIARLRLLLVMFVTLTVSVSAWGAYTYNGTGTFNKQASVDGDGYYVFVLTQGSLVNTCSSNYNVPNATYMGSENTLIDVPITSVLQVTNYNATDKDYYILNNSGEYLYSSATKKIEYSTSNSQRWTTSGEKLKTTSGTSVYMGYVSSSGYRPYTNSSTNPTSFVCVYKLEIPNCISPATALSISNSNTAMVGIPLTLTTNGGNESSITWSVKNGTGSATISSSTLTPTAAGTVTVTATQEDYNGVCGSTTTLTITISKVPATITLSELGDISNPLGTYYVGDQFTLPSTSSQSCESKILVGWSTYEVAETDTKPTENYYELGEQVTLTATQTFYAVFANVETTPGETTTEWVETEIASIASNDEVVITMSKEGTTWALRDENGTSNPPVAEVVSINNGQVTSTIVNNMIWIIEKNSNNLTFYKDNAKNDWLYCTNTNNGVRVGTNTNKVFTISGNYLKNTATSRYVGVYITNSDWRCYDNTAGNIADQILAFYKKTTTSTSTETITNYTTQCTTQTSQLETPDDLDATDITSTSAILYWTAVANADGYRVTINGKTIDTGSTTYTATELTANTSYTWTVTAIGNGTTYSDSETASHTFTTLAAASDPYTVTFDAGSGTCTTTSLTEASGGAGVTLPTASPSDACTEEGWTFAGWAEASVATETTTAPTTLLAAGDTYNPTADCPLYAVYSITETGSGGSGDYELVTSAPTDWSGTYLIVNTDDKKAWKGSATSDNNAIDVTITDNTIVSEATTDAETFTIAIMEGGYSICGTSGKYISGTSGDNTTNYGTSAALNTISIDEDNNVTITSNTSVLRQNNANSSLFRYYKSSTYSSQHPIQLYRKSAGSSTTYYHSTPSCVPTYSITYDFAGGTGSHCSNTSVPQGDSYTICDEAPTKEGHTFLGWSYGTELLQAGATITPTTDTTLTAQWQIKTYTVTWSNNGVTTPVTYEHGDDLTLPSAPASCDGVKEFVGWTEDNTFTYHATTPPTDLFKTTTATVTADKTYYAVFATKGEGGTEFVLGESGTFKMYANVDGTNYYAQGGVSSSQITSTTNALSASDYTLTYAEGSYTIQQGTSDIGHNSGTSLSSTSSTWTISAGTNGSWRITSNKDKSRALSYSSSANAFKAYATSNITAGDETYFDIEFGSGSSGYSDYTTTCQQIESIEVQSPQTEFYLTDDFTIGSGKVIATLSGGGTTDVTGDAHFSGYNMEVVGTYTVTVTYMGATATYNINVQPLDNAWVLTWNVSGKTNTGLGPRSVTKGSAIGTLPVPEVPAACAGKTFMGWTESNIVPSDGVGIVYITEETVPTDNTTYYAVFATVNNFSVQKPIEDIESGSKVVVVAVASLTADGGSGKAISSRTISITSQGVIGLSGDEVSISDETINTPHSTCIWTLTKEGGGIVLEQDGNYIRAVDDGYRKLLLETTKDYWTLTPVEGKYQTYYMQSGNTEHYVEWFDHTDDKYDEGEKYIGFVPYIETNENGNFDMQFFVTLGDNADITDYTTGCEEYTITYYGFRGGYSTSTSSDGIIVLPVNSLHTVPNCGDVVTDHTNLGREFLDVWMTQPHGGHTFKPGDTFILTQDTTLYAQWKMETTSDVTTLPTDIEDLAGTDVYVYGGKTLNIQPGSTTINSLTLKGGIQSDGSYKMPIVWVPEGATLVRNSNKIYLDLVVNAKNYYPFAVPFAAKNNENVEYLEPVLAAASTYGTHFAIKTYNGARRAEVGEDKANNWKRVLRDETLQPGVGYIITALTYPDKDTATIRIPMTVPNTWFENGEQTVVGTTTRNTVSVVGHTGEAAEEHQRHAGWNFVACPYLSNFSGNNIGGEQGYINGWIDVTDGSFPYYDTEVPYVTIPAYDFSYYTQHKLSDVKLSPEWSFFVQIGTNGTMNFSTDGRQEIPASIAARHDAAQSIRMDVDIVLSDKHHSDQMGLIICDRFTSAYEIGYDLEKMFGSAYNLTVYTLMEDNTPLAYQALAIHSNMQVIPVGYRVPEQGDYTFTLNQSTSSIDLLNEQYEQLILVDYETGALTNLLNSSYTFTSPRTQSNSRFAIYAVMRQDIPTDLPNIDDGDTSTRKILHNGHLYILRDGKVYNGHGQIVKQ